MIENLFNCLACSWKWSVYYSGVFDIKKARCPACGEAGKDSDGNRYKICNKCNEIKSIEDFYPNNRNTDNHTGDCKKCRIKYNRKRNEVR